MTSNSALAPPRALMPDLIRAFALIGIALVNVMGFAQPALSGYYNGALDSQLDQAAFGAVTGLFFMKSYPLFSMMFGAGLAWQLAAAERARADGGARYFRRMAALFALGALHFIFFWYGDILMTYALLGCLLFTMRGLSPKSLVITGIALIALNTFVLLLFAAGLYAAEAHAPEVMTEVRDPVFDEAQTLAFTEGGFLAAAAWRFGQLPSILPSVILQQGIAVFGFFCFGLAAVKAGTIDAPQARIWRLSRWVLLPIGLLGSAWGTTFLLDAPSIVSGSAMLGMAILMGFSPFSALGYAGVISLFSTGRPGPVRTFIARAGSASLTAYLFQSVLLSFAFAAYGLGLFGEMTAAGAILTALVVALSSLVFTGTWRSFAKRGPMEGLLRRVTYWSRA